MMKDTSYSKIPSNYGLCAADCPRGDTCLRRIAYDRIPANVVFPPTLHLKAIEAMAGKCKYYRSNEKVVGESGDIIRSGKEKRCCHRPSSSRWLRLPGS